MKVSIIGFYSSSRKAELTMFIPFIRKLEENKKIKEIFISTPFPYLETRYKELREFKKLRIINLFNFSRLVRSMLHSNIVFGIFGDALTNRHNLFSQFYNYSLFLLTVFLKKKLALVSNTLFMPAFPNLLKLGEKNIIYCSVRDDKSLFLSKKFFPNKCKLMEDISFNFFKNVSPKREGKKLIVCLRNNSDKIAKIKRSEYSKILARLISRICFLLNLREVLFLALDFGVRKVGMDYLLHEEIKKELNGSGLIVNSRKCAPDVHSLIKEFEKGSIILTSRFHGIVFSLCFEKPFLVIDNDYKTLYFMKAHNIENFFLQPKDVLDEKKIDVILKSIPTLNKKLKKIRKKIFRESKAHLNEVLNLIY